MPSTLESVYQAALTLSEEERAELADRILDSLSAEAAPSLHPAWRDELRRRSAQIDSGEVQPVPWEEVRRRAWEALDKEGSGPHG